MPESSVSYDLIIVGAGCAGMSLALRLLRGGFTGRTAIIDERSDFTREQRWCTWGPVDPIIAPFAAHSWPNWRVLGPGTDRQFQTPNRPYVEFYAPDFFAAVAAEIAAAARCDLLLNCRVHEARQTGKSVTVEAGDRLFSAPLVIDALNAGSGALAKQEKDETRLWQSFVGCTVRTDHPAFDLTCATLMDFRYSQRRPGQFFYLLPYTPDSALVECTLVGPTIPEPAELRTQVERYLAAIKIGGWKFIAEETGAIPMTTKRFRHRQVRRILPLGIAGGAAKPSTGYAFARIQRQTRAVADALCAGRTPTIALPERFAGRQLLDSVFLDVMASDPAQFQRRMLSLFNRVPPETVIRFLSEESSAAEDLQIMGAVGDLSFAAPMMRRLLG